MQKDYSSSGFENFWDIQFILVDITQNCPNIEMEPTLKIGEGIKNVEEFLKSEFTSHLQQSSVCASI